MAQRVVVEISVDTVPLDWLMRWFEHIGRPPYAGMLATDPWDVSVLFDIEDDDPQAAREGALVELERLFDAKQQPCELALEPRGPDDDRLMFEWTVTRTTVTPRDDA